MEYRGLALPMNKTTGGYFASAHIEDLVWSSILLILFTEKKSMPGRRNFGTNLTKFFFDQVNSARLAELQSQIISEINYNEPRVIVQSVIVAKKDHQIYIRIRLILKFNLQQSERAFAYGELFY